MKKFLLLALTGAVMAVSSCSDDDSDDFIAKSLTYSGNQLAITTNATPVLGKVASITTLSKKAAAVSFEGADFDLSSYVGDVAGMIPGIPTSLPTPGVLPGSSVLSFEVALVNGSTFSGSHETEYCTFDYAGSFTDSLFTCDFTNVKLKNQSIVGTFKPATAIDEWWGETIADGFMLDWESTDSIQLDLFGNGTATPFPIGTFAELAISMATGANPADKIQEHLNSMTFGEDGNVTISYVEDAETKTSPLNVCQYVVTGPNTLKAFLNPAAILAAASGARSRAGEDLDLGQLVQSLAENYVPMVRDGVNLGYTAVGDSLNVFITTEFMQPLFVAAGTVLEIPEIQQLIISAATESMPEDMAMMAPMLEQIVPQLPAVLRGTTKFEAGLKLVK